MKDDYLPIKALRFRRVSFLYARRYNGVSVSASAVSERKWREGVWKERDKTFQRVPSSEKEADVFPPTKAWLLSLESRKMKTA